MDEEKLLNAIDKAEETAYGSDEKGELSTDRALAIKMFLGKKPATSSGAGPLNSNRGSVLKPFVAAAARKAW